MNELEQEIADIDADYQPKIQELELEANSMINAAVRYWNERGVYVKTDPRYKVGAKTTPYEERNTE